MFAIYLLLAVHPQWESNPGPQVQGPDVLVVHVWIWSVLSVAYFLFAVVVWLLPMRVIAVYGSFSVGNLGPGNWERTLAKKKLVNWYTIKTWVVQKSQQINHRNRMALWTLLVGVTKNSLRFHVAISRTAVSVWTLQLLSPSLFSFYLFGFIPFISLLFFVCLYTVKCWRCVNKRKNSSLFSQTCTLGPSLARLIIRFHNWKTLSQKFFNQSHVGSEIMDSI